ncbi:DASH complex subunit Dad4 [Gamsiella multidivaricata]|uniref:DASH complex subunit Dad4 n=1 Tax=Gamsiella multidivaricata TaxID=101098 RepID=UPI0022202225|nr:DASH complex subunit Dad4 [Gamsiella multidivaricata]KAI7816790.1 DASH complex subunit Dad4 [Gamsiella multidivaricata]
MNPHQEQQAALLNRIALNVEKLNDSLEQLNEKLAQVNDQNQRTVLIAEIWNAYSKSAHIMLEGLGGIQPPE